MKLQRNGLLALLAALSLTLAPAIHAFEDGDNPDGGGPEKKIERLKEKLGLNDDQATKLKDLFEAEKVKRDAARKESHDKIAAILTPEQTAKFDEIMKELKEKMKEKRGKHKKG